MDTKDINDLYSAGYKAGSDIADAVNEAIDSNDFSGLASSIRRTVKDVTDSMSQDVRSGSYRYSSAGNTADENSSEPNRQTHGYKYSYKQTDRHGSYGKTYRSSSDNRSGAGDTGNSNRNSAGNAGNRNRSSAGNAGNRNRSSVGNNAGEPVHFVRYSNLPTPFLQKRPSRQSGRLKEMLGFLGMIFGGFGLLGNWSSIIVNGMTGSALGGFLAWAVIAAAGIYAVISGSREHALIARYYEYGQVIGTAEYIELRKLAFRTHHTKDEVLADLKKLMAKGILPEARFDEQETTLMLSDEVYEQYRTLREQFEQQRTAQEWRAEWEKQSGMTREQDDASLPADAREILQEGSAYIQAIHHFNDEIPGQEMSDKLDQLESTMNRILEQVRRQPGSAADLRKLMNYYLPTTVKLLDAYVQLDRQDVNSENAVNTRREIEEALDMINDAFDNLLNSLFQDMAWDISSDISVMKTMFAQDGLTKSQMKTDTEAVESAEANPMPRA